MAIVGHIEYKPADIKIPVKFNGRTGMFYCSYASTYYQDTQINTLRDTVLTIIKDTYTSLEWRPIIVLTFSGTTSRASRDASYENASCVLLRERRYVTYHKGLGFKQSGWEVPPQSRLASSTDYLYFGATDEQITLPAYVSNHHGTITILPYSEELWTLLTEIQHYIQIAAKSIGAQLSNPERIAALVVQCRSLFDHAATAHDNGEGDER